MNNKLLYVFTVALMISLGTNAQLNINNAIFTIETGAVVTVQGNLSSNVDVGGGGKILLKGSALQTVDMHGFTIPNLEVDNTSNISLINNAKIGSSLLFTHGKIQLGAYNLTLSNVTTIAGQGLAPSNFVETNGTGQLLKSLTANVTSVELPVGVGTTYRPVFVTTTGTYSNAIVGVKALAVADPNKPSMISDYVTTHWPVTKTGITGSVTISGQYNTADISGTEANLRGYFFNGTDWSSTGETHDAALNRVAVPITTASGDVYGMDKFVLVKTKALLQGPYVAATGLMTDGLRTPVNVIPASDPYRTAPYNAYFTHVANTITETAAAGVFANQAIADNNIVDWVFLELRTNGVNPGGIVAQTRSALITRAGNIVDVDGISPVTFNNVANGNYTVAVRHRNHLGLSADPVANLLAVAEQKSTVTLLDLSTATDAQLYGTTTAYSLTSGKNLLWSGNVNGNTTVRYNGPSNDRDFLLATILSGNQGSILGTAAVPVYNIGDVNMNGIVRFNGPSNDRDFMLATSLGASQATIRTQALPTN
ncbi:MAG: hypothetical protein ABI402_19920 [Ferruginibacter sp.]